MKDGLPMETEELDLMRSRQRLELFFVHGWIVQAVQDQRIPLTIPDGFRYPEQKSLAEIELRGLADIDRKKLHEELLSKMETHTRAQTLRELLWENLKFGAKQDPFESIADSLEKEVKQNTVGNLNIYDEEVIATLYRYVACLMWADELAGDYRDPRLLQKKPA